MGQVMENFVVRYGKFVTKFPFLLQTAGRSVNLGIFLDL
jgi:cytochrome c-type biogenesis protein CcmH/NrfF